jgi:hypothetical protein
VSTGAKPKKVILLANGLPVEKFSDGTIAPPPCIAVPETLELLLDAATTKLDLHHGARHIFDEARPARTAVASQHLIGALLEVSARTFPLLNAARLLARCGAERCGAVRCGAVRCGAVLWPDGRTIPSEPLMSCTAAPHCRMHCGGGAAWRTAVQAGREILRIGDVPNGGILFVSQGEPFKGDGTLSPRGSTPRKPAVAAELNGNGKHKGKALAGAVRCGADLRLAVRAAPCSAVGPPTACRSCGVRWSRSSSTAPSGGPETRQRPETQTHRPFPLSVYHTCAHAFCPPRPPQPSPASARRHGLACEQAKRVALALLVGRRRHGSPVLHLGCMLCWLHAACYSVRACVRFGDRCA